MRIACLEKFTGGGLRKDDAERGEYDGITDTLILNGDEVTFEPFRYRTFRFIAIEMDKTDTRLLSASYRETGHPLEIGSWVGPSAIWVKEVRELCVRTLRRRMNETYMDCPCYEQNRFPMDTRLTVKAPEDFHRSISPDGLVHGRYPGSCQRSSGSPAADRRWPGSIGRDRNMRNTPDTPRPGQS